MKDIGKIFLDEDFSLRQKNYYKELLLLHSKYKFKIERKSFFCISSKEALERLYKGFPILDPKIIDLKIDYIKDLFYDLCSLFQRYSLLKKEELVKAEEIFTKDIDWKKIIEENINNKKDYFQKLSQRNSLDLDILLFFSINLIKPFLELLREDFSSLLDSIFWFRNICPICGGLPYISKLSKDEGKRFLKCFLCEEEWRFYRIKCPICNNEDQDSLRYIFIEDSPYRIDLCERCKYYIKVFDERNYFGEEKQDLFLDNLNSYYLDIKAMEEGYKNITLEI